MSAVILVEGVSDQATVEALARRSGRDLGGEGVQVVPIGGAQAIGRAIERFRETGVMVTGLCDAGEEAAAEGDLRPFRTMQKQPEWRGRPVEDQLRRFLGSGARRKVRYASLLVDALDLDRVPEPLAGLIEHTFVAY